MSKFDQNKIKEISERLGITMTDVEYLISVELKAGTSSEEAIRILEGKAIKIITLQEAAEQQDKSEKIPCGMEVLDEAMSGGISAGSSVVIAAPSGEGKTQFMVSLSYHFLKQHIPCLWFSFEENVADIWERFKLTGIENNTPAFCPLDLIDNKINYLEDVVKEFKKTNSFFIVFIDQLSFLAPKLTEKSDINHIQGNYSMYLGQISNQIKTLAMDYQIIIFFAHQLGRTGDVAYSDMIKHAPDKVLYLKRIPDASPDATEEFTDKTMVIFKKNRPYGNRPKIMMTVEKGLFVPIKKDGAVTYAKQLGWKEVDANNLF